MYRVGIVEFVGYRFWTESLGSDREWIIQTTQASLYNLLHSEFSKIGCFLYHLRYDYMIFMDGNSKPKDYIRILEVASKNSPVPVRISIACGKTPFEAQNNATRNLLSMEVQGLIYPISNDCKLSPLAAVHVDFNDFTLKTYSKSIYETYDEILNFYIKFKKFINELGGLVFYLGGDNILAFLPLEALNKVTSYISEIPGVKSGIGIHKIPKNAVTLATKALDGLRKNSRSLKNKVLILGNNVKS